MGLEKSSKEAVALKKIILDEQRTGARQEGVRSLNIHRIACIIYSIQTETQRRNRRIGTTHRRTAGRGTSCNIHRIACIIYSIHRAQIHRHKVHTYRAHTHRQTATHKADTDTAHTDTHNEHININTHIKE
jgi:hypothetical protein